MLFSRNKLKPYFSFTNNRQIWRLLFSARGRLIIEERDVDKKLAFFNCIELESKRIIFKDYTFDEKFWIGIEAVHNELIYLHHYTKPDMPYHKGIIAFDIESQKIIWQNNELVFEFASGSSVYASMLKFDGKKYFKLNHLTGEIVEEFENDSMFSSIKKESEQTVQFDGFIIPYLTAEMDEVSQSVFNSIIKERSITGSYEYAVSDNYLLCAYHLEGEDKLLTQHFLIIDINRKKTIFAENTGKQLKSFRVETFFIKSGILFLIKNKSELLLFDLT